MSVVWLAVQQRFRRRAVWAQGSVQTAWWWAELLCPSQPESVEVWRFPLVQARYYWRLIQLVWRRQAQSYSAESPRTIPRQSRSVLPRLLYLVYRSTAWSDNVPTTALGGDNGLRLV